MDEEELFSCLIRMSAPIIFDSNALTDEQVGHQVRKAHNMFLEFREITV